MARVYVDESGRPVLVSGSAEGGFGTKHIGQVIELNGRVEPVASGWSLMTTDATEIQRESAGSIGTAAKMLVEVYLRSNQPPKVSRLDCVIIKSKNEAAEARIEYYEDRFRGRITKGSVVGHTGVDLHVVEIGLGGKARTAGKITLWHDEGHDGAIEGRWEDNLGEWK